MAIFHRTLLLLALSLSPALGQTPSTAAASAPLPIYDAVAIHENKAGAFSPTYWRWGDDSFTATNTTLIWLLTDAYNIRQDLISGLPGWASSFHFDINAKVSDPDVATLKNLTREQRSAMIIALLNDRFHLRAHIETKTLPVYNLVIAKGGSKLKENNALPGADTPGTGPHKMAPGTFVFNTGQFTGTAMPLSILANNLADRVQRNVIDKTGLTGKYDIYLKWTPPELEGKPEGLTDNPPPDLFTALQEQLGLKLEPSKGPVDTLVIDHVEMPTAN